MIDRVYFLWQAHHAPQSYKALHGTRTILNFPPSDNATLEDIQDLNFVAGPAKLGDLLNTLDGPFCYIYA